MTDDELVLEVADDGGVGIEDHAPHTEGVGTRVDACPGRRLGGSTEDLCGGRGRGARCVTRQDAAGGTVTEIRVVLVEDHPMYRAGSQAVLEGSWTG